MLSALSDVLDALRRRTAQMMRAITPPQNTRLMRRIQTCPAQAMLRLLYPAPVSATTQRGLSSVVFLLIDLTASKALVQDAERVIGANPSRRDSNRPQYEPHHSHN